MKRKLNVLIACEESQAECLAFRELGHIAYSCDIQKCITTGNPDWHINDDCIDYLYGKTSFVTQSGKRHRVKKWDLIIAHPPCTYLCKVSSVQLYKEPLELCTVGNDVIMANKKRVENMLQARSFFMKCLGAQADYVAVENPLPMRLARLPKPSFFVCPSWFGVKYTKKTLYWVKNLPPIMSEYIYPNAKSFVRSSRGKYRSRTFPALARAIACQWSEYILDDYL